jgi:hypothetical protein
MMAIEGLGSNDAISAPVAAASPSTVEITTQLATFADELTQMLLRNKEATDAVEHHRLQRALVLLCSTRD